MLFIVIPAYNEEKNIARCLQALVDQKTSHPFQVILVDNNSTDITVKIAQTFSKKLNLTIIHEKQKGRGPARKAGFDRALTNAKDKDVIFSTDADAQVLPNWVETLYLKLTKSNAIAISGMSKLYDATKREQYMFNKALWMLVRTYRMLFGHYWLAGFSFAIYADAYKKSGGFHPKLNIQEDIDLSMKVHRVGKILFLKEPLVYMSGRRFSRGIFHGLMQYLLTFFRHHFLHDETVEIPDPR